MGIYDYFRTALIAQLFYAFAITILVYGLSSFVVLNNVEIFTSNTGISLDEVSQKIDTSFSSQLNVPLVDLGSLVFFSGNFIADLILNFITAVPNMFNILISGVFLFFPIDAVLQNSIKVFITIVGSILYIISTLAFLAEVRSGHAL